MSEGFQERLDYVLGTQAHCDHFLPPLADPRGKSVLVVGAGAGTEMLWAMRHGAGEVVGIDKAPQDRRALEVAIDRLGVEPPPWELVRLSGEEAASLGRGFDLVLSYNVLEHLPDPARVLAACGRLVEPRRGRIAVFTDPLYYSSAGSHLPLEPWEHLWGDPDRIRERLLAAASAPVELAEMSLGDYLDREISLNRIRLGGLLEAIAASGLVPLHLGIVPDRRIGSLGAHLDRLRLSGTDGPSVFDLAVEGFFAELAVPTSAAGGGSDGDVPDASWKPTHQVRAETLKRETDAELWELRGQVGFLQGRLDAERESAERYRQGVEWHRERVREVKEVLDAVEASASFRIGRALTAPVRWLRRLRRGARTTAG